LVGGPLGVNVGVPATAHDPVTSRHRQDLARLCKVWHRITASQTQYCDHVSAQPIEPSGLGGEINVIAPKETMTQMGALLIAEGDIPAKPM
jgi:hypothetical protein